MISNLKYLWFSISLNLTLKLMHRGRTSTGTRMNLKKRSPSPVVTGKVSSYRNKFEPSSPTSPGPTLPRYRKDDLECRRCNKKHFPHFLRVGTWSSWGCANRTRCWGPLRPPAACPPTLWASPRPRAASTTEVGGPASPGRPSPASIGPTH